jgi:uncharacterized protein
MAEHLSLLPDRYAVCRLDPDAPTPDWATDSALSCITRSATELSVLCVQTSVPSGVTAETGWAALVVAGPLAFTAVGVLASILQPLAQAEISVFVLSSFDTDYILLKQETLTRATNVLMAAGHTIT